MNICVIVLGGSLYYIRTSNIISTSWIQICSGVEHLNYSYIYYSRLLVDLVLLSLINMHIYDVF